MDSLPDAHTEARHAALRDMQASLSHADARDAALRDMQAGPARQQSDFEMKLAFRLAFLVATVVIGFNLFAPPPPLTHSATAAQHARS